MPIQLDSTDPEEQYANAFAFALLMPEDAIRELHREGHSCVILAYEFGVPADIMARRLRQLGLPMQRKPNLLARLRSSLSSI